MKKIILFGGGGHCYAVAALINYLEEYEVEVIYDDAPKQSTILNIPVKKYDGCDLSIHPLCITIGSNNVRKRIATSTNAEFPTFIHPSAVVCKSSNIGKGSVVLPNSVIDADVTVGKFCIVNNNATVSHNARLGNYVHIAIQSAISGGVDIGEGTLVGAGAVILPDISIGEWVTIGAGSVVTKDVPNGSVVYGNPAKIISSNKI